MNGTVLDNPNAPAGVPWGLVIFFGLVWLLTVWGLFSMIWHVLAGHYHHYR